MNPKYNEYMKPLLVAMSNGTMFQKRDLYELMINELQLSNEDLAERIPSGSEPTYANRIGWALSYLKKATLILSPSRAMYQITQRGLEVLEESPVEIDSRYLMKFEEFRDFKQHTRVNNTDEVEVVSADESPEDLIGRHYEELVHTTTSDLIDEIISMSPRFFERLVLDLLEEMGYGKAEGTTYVNDQGIDGIIKSDKLGLDRIYVQAKRYSRGNVVGRPEVNSFAGALLGKRGTKGVFITTSNFSQPAVSFAESLTERIILIDGEELGALLYEYNVGVQKVTAYVVKKIDRDYFEE